MNVVSAHTPKVPGVIRVMAAAAGTIGANVHYSQPLLPLIAVTMGATAESLSALPAVTQIGFAIGLLVVLPLADMLERKKLVLVTVLIAMAALVGQALAPSLLWLLIAGFFVGAASVAPQVLSPFAAALAPPGREGQASGIVLSGILMGVLVSKIVAGFVGDLFGWQALYMAASVAMLVLAVVLWRMLPVALPTEKFRLSELVLSPIRLLREFPTLRLHAWLGALGSAAFMGFWATYAIHLHVTFGWGALVAGLFGIAGIAGSLLAPLAGSAVDRGKVRAALVIAGGAMLVAYLLLAGAASSAVGIILAVVVLDAGVGVAHSSNQARVLRLDPARRGRLNSVYMFSYFIGGAAGTAAAATAYSVLGWIGVCLVGAVIAVLFLGTTAAARRAFGATP